MGRDVLRPVAVMISAASALQVMRFVFVTLLTEVKEDLFA